MSISECKKDALDRLKGKWGKAVCIILAYLGFNFLIGCVSGIFVENETISLILSIVELVITAPIAYGFIYAYMNLYNGDQVGAFEFIKLGFSNFGKSWKVSLWTALKMLLPAILMIISYALLTFGTLAAAFSGGNTTIILLVGFVLLIISMILMVTVGLYYSLGNMIAIDNPDMTAKDAVNTSKEMMRGNRGSLFLLQLSFIGWGILAILPIGIGLLWLAPYMQLSTIAFYKKLKNEN